MTETRALVLKRQSASRRIVGGAVVTATAPVAAAIALALKAPFHVMPLIVASIYMAIAGGIGLGSVAVGTVRLRQATKRMRELEEARVPKARLLT